MNAAAEARLGEGDRGMRHALLVVRAIGRQLVAHLVERLADAGDVAVAEDRQDAAEDRHASRRRSRSSGRVRKRASACAMVRRIGLRHGRSPPASSFMPPRGRARASHASVEALEPPRHVGDRRLVVDLAAPASARPASAKIVRPTAKPLHDRRRRRRAKPRPARPRGASRPSSTTPRQYGSLLGRSPRSIAGPGAARRLRLELPPVRLDAERRRARSSARGDRVVVERAVLAGDDLDQQLAADLARGLVQRAQLLAPARPSAPAASSGMIEAQALDAVVDRPFDQLRCRGPG